VPVQTIRIVTVPVMKAIRQGVGIGPKTDDLHRATDSSFVLLDSGSLFDHPCQDQALRSCSHIVSGNRTQVGQLQRVIEPVVARRRPRATQLVEVDQRVGHSPLDQQLSDRRGDRRLTRSDRAGDQQRCWLSY
jgi:hypothetical protein